jgi:hypothetical protein
MIMKISLFGQFWLWAPSSGVRDVFTATANVNSMMMMVRIGPFCHLGLWSPASGVQDVFTATADVDSMMMMMMMIISPFGQIGL